MPAKTPIYLKTTTDRKGRRLKLRDVLSGDMISPPLGDVKHSAHVGPQGEADMFGDVAFLQGKMDMLPFLSGPHNGHGCSLGLEHPQDLSLNQDSYSSHYQQLRTTTSLPLLIAQEQAPPKPPRLHLDPPPHYDPAHCPHPDMHPHRRTSSSPQPEPGLSLSPVIHQLVPSSGSFSEGSSEDSLSDTCGPLEVPRGLSLDSDAGLSNEDLRSEFSESPCSFLHPSALKAVSRSDSIMAGLDLDLGPSIMDDVLSIMDRY